MILTDSMILELMQKPRNGANNIAGVKLQNDHKVHITGDGYLKLVKQVQGFESSNDFNVKTQIASLQQSR
jgi:hypothetical protein